MELCNQWKHRKPCSVDEHVSSLNLSVSAPLSATDDLGIDETDEVVALNDVVDEICCDNGVDAVHGV